MGREDGDYKIKLKPQHTLNSVCKTTSYKPLSPCLCRQHSTRTTYRIKPIWKKIIFMYHYSDTTCILFLRVRGFSQYVGYISQTCTYCLYFGWIDVSENILTLLPRLLLTFTFLWQPYLRLQQKFIIPRFNEWYFHIFWLHSLYVFLL